MAWVAYGRAGLLLGTSHECCCRTLLRGGRAGAAYACGCGRECGQRSPLQKMARMTLILHDGIVRSHPPESVFRLARPYVLHEHPCCTGHRECRRPPPASP